ncbi:hypothetical protein KEM54_003169 [Ascosphaera aggregata]|nr:hypothetical protein KEM54_003169 [Ascosphaera aggregata]
MPNTSFEEHDGANMPEEPMPSAACREQSSGGGNPMAMLGQGETVVTELVQQAVPEGPMRMVAGKLVHKLFERLEGE